MSDYEAKLEDVAISILDTAAGGCTSRIIMAILREAFPE